jgi:branched-chain amino acid transport system permease protein
LGKGGFFASVKQLKAGDIPVAKALGIGILIIILPLIFSDRYMIRVMGNAGIWIMLTLGLNVVCGFAGLLDLGYVVFWGIGGYAYALLSSGHFGLHLPLLVSLPASIAAAVLLGLFVSGATLRVAGDYLGIVTLAFMQIFRLLLINMDRPINITGGPNGINDIDAARIFGFRFNGILSGYYLIWFFALIIILFSLRLKRSRLGRAWEAIREDELASKVMGVNTVGMKILAFVTGAGIAGVVGSLYASWQRGIYPNNFDFGSLNTIYCMLILGGIGNIRGVVFGALVLSIVPEFLRDYGDWRMIGYGLMLVIFIALRPQGLFGGIDWDSLLKFFKLPAKKNISGESAGETRAVSGAGPGMDYVNWIKPMVRTLESGSVLLELKDVTMSFGGLTAVDNLSLKVGEGEIVSLIGPNGAGKTTVFNVITGIYEPSRGDILFHGESIKGEPPNRIVRRGIARTFQTLRLYNKMSVLDNVKVARYCRTRNKLGNILFRLPDYLKEEREVDRIARENIALFGPEFFGKLNLTAGDLSYADRRRLEIVRALATGAKLILLDEPSAGMNPKETEEIGIFIKRLRDDYGLSFLVIEHKLNFVKTLSDYVNVLDYGKKIADGTYDHVANDPYVIEAYMGRQTTNG